MKYFELQTVIKRVKGYFNVLPDKDDENETISRISSGVKFHGANLWVLIFAIFTASLGLNVNSTAVIIGAMLISPLMGPIIGMGLAVGINDLELLQRSAKNYGVATIISVLTATIYFLVTPLTEAQSELLARTSPTLYDVLIALCGGAAGILALSTKDKGNVIPGVAIATALMPPLCTAGYGLAMGELSYFFGAFYLFFINTVFICLATFVGVRLMKFKSKKFDDKLRFAKVRRYIVAIVVVTMLPATYMTVQIITQSVKDNNANMFVRHEMTFSGTQILTHNLDIKNKTLRIVAVGKIISDSAINAVTERMDNYNLGDYKLNIIQGSQSDSLLMLNKKLSNVSISNETNNKKLAEQAVRINELETLLNGYTRFEQMQNGVLKEMQVIYPWAQTLSVANVREVNTTDKTKKQYVMAVVGRKGRIEAADRTKLQDWLKLRLGADSLRLIVTP